MADIEKNNQNIIPLSNLLKNRQSQLPNVRLQESAVATAECSSAKSAVVTAELQKTQNQIDIYHSIYVPNVTEFPVEDFFAVPFTHHISLIEKTKDLEARH